MSVAPSGTDSRATSASGTSAQAAASDAARNSDRPAVKSRGTRGTRNLALLLTSLALAFYFGFIAITIYRSHH